MTHAYVRHGVGQPSRLVRHLVCLTDIVGVVDIESEPAHDGEMVPQLLLEVYGVLTLWKHAGHGVDDGLGTALPHFPVRQFHGMVNHELNLPAIFWQYELLACGVVV